MFNFGNAQSKLIDGEWLGLLKGPGQFEPKFHQDPRTLWNIMNKVELPNSKYLEVTSNLANQYLHSVAKLQNANCIWKT